MSGRQLLSQEQRNVGTKFEYAIGRTCILSIMVSSRFSMCRIRLVLHTTQYKNGREASLENRGLRLGCNMGH